MAAISVITQYITSNQTELDGKKSVASPSVLQDLGDDNYKAYTYPVGLRVVAKSNNTVYVWREEKEVDEAGGLITGGFTYPTLPPIDGFDYSGKTFNFFIDTKPVEEIETLETTVSNIMGVSTTEITAELLNANLTTSDKTSIIAAINEVKSQASTNETSIANLTLTVNSLVSDVKYAIPQSGNTPANEPAPTVDGIYTVAEAGTYTNFGGLVVASVDNLDVKIVVSGTQTVFQLVEKTLVTLDSTPTLGSPNAVSSNGVKVALDAETIARKLDILDKSINFKGNDNVNNLLPQLSGMSVGGASFTFQEVTETAEKLSLLPIDSDKIFRINYVVGAEMFLTLNTSLALSNKIANYYGWVRKSDLLNLPDSFTFMIYSILGGVNQDIGKLNYILPSDFVKGYSQSKTVGESTIKVEVLADTGEWLFFINTFTTTSDDTHFIPRIYINNVGVGEEGKLDFLNLTAYCSQDNVNILLPSLKSGETYTSSLEKKIDSEVVTLNESIYETTIDKSINFKGSKPAINGFPQLAGFITGQGFTFAELIVDENLPVDTNKIFRGTYTATSEGRIDPWQTPIDLPNKKGYCYGWIRKSDVESLADSLTFMMFTRQDTSNQDIVKLDYIAKNDFVKGYKQTKTVGASTVVLDVISEFNGWILFYVELTTTSVTANNFFVRFYVNNTTTGKLDFVNYTATNSIENVNILLESQKSTETIIDKFKEVEIIDVANSDNIVFVADSYTESEYTLDGKSYIQNVSALTDYQIRNYAKSGDDIIEAINRININQVEFNTSLGIKDFNSKYAVIALYANDSPYRYWNIDMFKENLRDLVQRLRGLGIEPIISSEFFLYNFFSANPGVADTSLMQDIADELGIGFIDVAQTSMNFIKARESDFWNGSHPTTRTNSVMWKPISDYLQSLPKPKKSLKLFRNRTVESNFATDTLYKDIEERNSKYQEIRVGQSSLTDANQIYFDRQSLVSNPISIDREDEYLKIQNGESISFSRHCLIECTLPYYSQNVDYIRVKFDVNTTVFPWVRKKKTPFASTKGTSFKYTGSPTIVIGDTYTVTSANGTINGKSIIITDNRDGYICADATTYAYPSPTATGTLTRTSGTGTSSITFDGVLASFVDDYYDNYANTYEWVSLTSTPNIDGYYYIDNTTKQYVEGDKVVFIVRQTTGFTLSDVSVEIPKIEGAEKLEVKGKYIEPLTYSGSSTMLTTRLTDTTGNLSNWTQEGTIVASNPIGNAYPRWTNGKVNLTDVNKISQALTFTNGRASQKIQIQVWANYEPAKFTGTNLATSPITLTSYDKTDLFIELYSTGQEDKAIKFQRKVGLGFQQILIDTFLPPDMVSPRIRLSGSALGVDVAYVDVLKYL